MTSKLKKRLGEIGVDTSSRRANENFCLIGTPLPPLEKSKDTGEFVPLWKQEVRDEKGRRRLHGAFTGGFSAGYFNTVGSKEGWAPATFVSSRNERAKKAAARPEDFMDEEDLQDLKDSRNIVDTTEEMDFLGGTQAELHGKTEEDDSEKDPITLALEASLLPTPKDSVGARILKKMGWRLGQGIGPRISLKQRKLQDVQAYDAATGARYSGGALDVPDDDEEAGKHTYAPRDTPVLAVRRKDNSHGLGYVPGLSLNESLGENVAGGSKGPRLAGGFGLGALNDADEDDLDVYDTHSQRSKRHVAYDQIDGEADDSVVIGGRATKQKSSTGSFSSSTQYLRDGRLVLAGFVLSNEPVAEDRWFPVPDVPSGWKPNPRRLWAVDKENVETLASPPDDQSHVQWKKSKISADQRGVILGETPLPSAPRSVFDYMSQKDRERIKSITSGLHGPASVGVDAKPAPPSILITKLEPHIAQAALQGFQPFTADPAKQARYVAYLWSQANQDGSAPALQPLSGQRIDEYNKEIEDYAKAASLFKPISGAMAGRFTSAAVIDFGPKIHEGLHTPTSEDIAAKEAQLRKEEEDKISPKAHAAKMGMYGPLTRERSPWQPAKLLCKRFGVKDPNPEPEIPAEAASKPAPSFTHTNADQPTTGTKDDTTPVQKSTGPRDLANIGLGEDEMQGQDTLTYERPPMDLFKAIFASDDEDSDDEGKGAHDDDDEPPIPLNGEDAGTRFTPATAILDDTPVDIITFKPKFIPREGKAKKSKDEEKSKEKKEKKEKKKKEKKAVLVSFELEQDDDDADASEVKQSKDRPKKKRKERKHTEDGGEEAMWAPKRPAENHAPPTSSPAPPHVSSAVQEPTSSGELGPRGRKRAIDFM
ncbi:hypothetical protein GALMADRAFT_135911 [Galerina marginata CBS 339.88]|uniref:G-patch domain-containing protein n=1 Tax=Galerina marginata (strain CBS 339.88) TaxID=685588 RepID=A0A067TLL4_GALM3|nr:hypothetical protein GALMADRAFT_135911 [Galerina marginata CBS 339.88]